MNQGFVMFGQLTVTMYELTYSFVLHLVYYALLFAFN